MLKSLKSAARFALAEGGSVKSPRPSVGHLGRTVKAVLAAVNLLRSVVLARLLTPEVFGLMALAGIAIRTIETFTRPGIAQALIARRGQFEEVSDTAFTMLVGRGVMLAIALAVAAPWVAAFFEADDLKPMLQVLSLVFVIGSFVNINTISRQRELEFRRLTYLSQATTLAGTVVTIAAAYWLRSVWALVIGQIATVSINVGLSYWLVGGRPRFGFDRRVARDLLAYGKFITGSSIVLFIANEVDSAAVGKLLGPEQLGYYAMAMTTATMVTANLSKAASSIMMPAYSKLQTRHPGIAQCISAHLVTGDVGSAADYPRVDHGRRATRPGGLRRALDAHGRCRCRSWLCSASCGRSFRSTATSSKAWDSPESRSSWDCCALR